MKFPVLWSGLCCQSEGWGGKCSEILATIKLLYNPRVNIVFTSLDRSIARETWKFDSWVRNELGKLLLFAWLEPLASEHKPENNIILWRHNKVYINMATVQSGPSILRTCFVPPAPQGKWWMPCKIIRYAAFIYHQIPNLYALRAITLCENKTKRNFHKQFRMKEIAAAM